MKVSMLSYVAAFSALASSQLAGLPSCAQECIGQLSGGSQIAGCSGLDIKCICNSQGFYNNLACCLTGRCDAADQATTIAYVQQLCITSGATAPNAITCFSVIGSSTSAATTSTPSTIIAISVSPTSSVTVFITGVLPSTNNSLSASSTSSLLNISSLLRTSGSSTTPAASLSATTSATSSGVGYLGSSTSAVFPAAKIVSIVIGVIAGLGLIALVIFFCIRRRRRLKTGSQPSVYPRVTELPTIANTHEMQGQDKSQLYEVSSEPSQRYQVSQVPYDHQGYTFTSEEGLVEADSGIPRKALPMPANTQKVEIQANKREVLSDSPQNLQGNETPLISSTHTPSLDAGGINADSRAPEILPEANPTDNRRLSSNPLSNFSHDSSSTAIPEAASRSTPSRLNMLQARMDRIHAEKERLTKLQELDELEAEVQRLIMEEQRREMERG